MYALIVSTSGEDYVHVSSTRERLDRKAIEIIKSHIDLSDESWSGFGSLEVERLLLESMEANEADSAMELFSDISEARTEMVFMRIVPADLELDA